MQNTTVTHLNAVRGSIGRQIAQDVPFPFQAPGVNLFTALAFLKCRTKGPVAGFPHCVRGPSPRRRTTQGLAATYRKGKVAASRKQKHDRLKTRECE